MTLIRCEFTRRLFYFAGESMAHINGKSPAQRPPMTVEEMQAETKRIRVANRLKRAQIESDTLESFSPYWQDYQGFGGTDSFERVRDGSAGLMVMLSVASDRKGGKKWPLWINDHDLNKLRQQSRILVGSNAFAQALIRNRTNYIIGKGFAYKASAKDTATAKQFGGMADEAGVTGLDKLRDGVQKVMDDFCQRNSWNATASPHDEDEDGAMPAASSTREREIHWRVDRDGEALVRLFYQENGTVDVRFIGPERVWGAPGGMTERDGWTFGIQHRMIETIDEHGGKHVASDEERILAYFIRHKDASHSVADEAVGGEIVSAREILHIKDPWEDAEVKRGTPAFAFDSADALQRAARLQRNMSVSSAVRAATAEIWQHKTGTKDEIQSLQSATPGGRTITGSDGVGRFEAPTIPGQTRRVPQSQEFVPFGQTTNIPDHDKAKQGDLRQAVAGFCAPEYMTGTTNEANYATASEAGTPFVNAAEAEQEHYKAAFVGLMWRVIRWAVKCGRLPQEALVHIDIDAEGSQVKKNNEGELATVRHINLQNKLTSPQIESAKIGNDPKRVIADWKEWAQQTGQGEQQGAGGGMPGAMLGGDDDGQSGGDTGGGSVADAVDPRRSQAAKMAAMRRGLGGGAMESREPDVDRLKWFNVPDDVVRLIESKDASGHEHDEAGRFTGGSGAAGSAPNRRDASMAMAAIKKRARKSVASSDAIDASSFAHNESLRANRDGGDHMDAARAHIDASDAHRAAAEHHRDGGDYDIARAHEVLAEYHQAMHEDHFGKM